MLTLANIKYDMASSYYTEAGTGTWQGTGAKFLGLAGEINPDAYHHLLRGRSPDGSQVFTGKKVSNSNRRVGTDFVFSPPKSVSLAVFLDDQPRIREAHREAVCEAIAQLEAFAGARVTQQRVTNFVPTRNNIVAVFEHIEARSVRIPKELKNQGNSIIWAENPHLHSHCVCINLTQLGDGSWRSLSNEQMVAHQKKVRQIYEGNLRRKIEELGYQTRDKGDYFELRGYSDDMIQLFSQRRQVIQWVKTELGKDDLTAWNMTRQPKRFKTEEDLKRLWQEKAHALNWDLLSQQHLLELIEAEDRKQRLADQEITSPTLLRKTNSSDFELE